MKLIKPGDANKPKTMVHRSKLFRGQKTAQEIHREYGMRGRCSLCSGPPTIMVRMMATIEEIKLRSPEYWVSICASAAQRGSVNRDRSIRIPFIATTYGKMIRFSTAYACQHHQKELEITAAKAPSWVLVEIDRGPGADTPLVSVDGQALT